MGHILQLGLFCLGVLPILLSLADRLPCDNTEICSCVKHASDENEYWCGVNRSQVIIEVRPDIGVKLACTGFDDSSYLDALKGIKSSPILQRFTLKQCPVPDKSFVEIFKIQEIDSVNEVCIELTNNAAANFKPSHFQNLGSLGRLSLWNNNITELPEYIFKDLTNLTRLYLNGNLLQSLPNKIFEPLRKLEWLDLGFNNFSTLDGTVLQSLSNLTLLNLYKNRLDNISKSLFASLTKLTSLDLSNNNMTRLKDGIFDNLLSLKDLNLSYNNLSRFPDKLFANNGQLKSIRLMSAFSNEVTTLPGAMFARTNLSKVHLESNNLVSLPKDLFRECANLKMVLLRKNSLKTLPSNLFKDTVNLEELDLSINNLESLDESVFNPLKKLKKLKLDRNHLTNIGSNLFANLISLMDLDLSRNELVDFEGNTFTDLKNLTKINLSHNKLTMGRSIAIGASPFNKCTNLQSLNLANNLLTMVFEDWRNTMTNLKTLDLSYNKLDSLTTADFMFTSANFPVTVNFSNNRIKVIDLHSLETLVKNQCQPYPCTEAGLKNRGLVEFTLENNPIKCNCDVFHLAKYFQNKMSPVVNKFVSLLPNGVYCDWPNTLKNILISDVDLKELKCPLREIDSKKDEMCPANCSCFYRPVDRAVIVNCTGIGVDKFPERVPVFDNPNVELFDPNVELLFGWNRFKSLDGLHNLSKMTTITRLSLSFNKLKSIDDFVLPRALKTLELDNNNITSLNNRTITQLTSSANLTTITLHKNPWDCNCETKYFLNFIRNQYKKIPYYQDIQCRESGHSIISLTEDDLCYISFTIILTCISLAIFGLVSGAVMALYYMYEHEIKVWMFAHKICLWLVAEKEIDKDKIYDAFVSFSHKDQEFVDKHLIPQLEKSNDHNYKLCIHYRDFIVGEFIPSQIVHSVENSRRTIIVLTPNFLESVWGRMEFRTAHLQAIKEGCARVIIIMLEDVSNEKLDPELKAYITMNTYVKWGDPLFWEKLKYALPHPQAYTKRTSNVAPLSEAELKKQQKLFNLDEIIRSKA